MLIGLLAVDGMLALIISHKFAHPEGQRLPAYDQDTVELWIDQIKKADGYKIILLGDSVIHGDAVESSFETLPAYVARELRESMPGRDARVFNLGLAGAGPAEAYLLLDALEGQGDPGQDNTQHFDCHGGHRPLARRGLALHGLGPVPRGEAVDSPFLQPADRCPSERKLQTLHPGNGPQCCPDL